MQKDKRRLTLMATVTILVLATTALYGFMAVSGQGVSFGNVIAMVIPLLAVIFMLFFIVRRYQSVKAGMPLEDERSKMVVTRAAAKSFYVSLYWLLAISWFESFFAEKLFGGAVKLDASQTVGGGIAGMAICFFIFWFYYNQKGKLD